MAVKVEIAKPEHIALIANDVRDADVVELMDGWGRTPERVMSLALGISVMAWTAWLDDEPACMFGVAPISLVTGRGSPWLVGTNAIDRHPKQFVRPCVEYVNRMASVFPRMENYVDSRNTKVIRWLERIGFTMGKAEAFGPKSLPFIKFTKEVSDV